MKPKPYNNYKDHGDLRKPSGETEDMIGNMVNSCCKVKLIASTLLMVSSFLYSVRPLWQPFPLLSVPHLLNLNGISLLPLDSAVQVIFLTSGVGKRVR